MIAPPGSANRVRGREAYVQSYRDYDSAAKTHSFQPSDPVIDVIGDAVDLVVRGHHAARVCFLHCGAKRDEKILANNPF